MKYKNTQNSIIISMILLLGFFLRLYSSLDFYLHDWDECYHALVSKNLMTNFFKPVLYSNPIFEYDYKSWTSNHIWLHKQPMALWMISISFKLFGVNEIALRFPSLLSSICCIYIIYKLAKECYSNRVALIAAFLFSTNGLIIELASGRTTTDHVDTLFLFFILSAVYLTLLYSKNRDLKYLILIGILTGLAILTKWLPALIILPIWFYISYSKNIFKETMVHFFILCVVIVIIAIPWQIYIFQYYPLEASWEFKYNTKHFFEVIELHDGNMFYYLNKIRINYGELIYLPLGWFFYKLIRQRYTKFEFFLFIWFLIPFLFFSIAKTKMPAYILFISPVLFIISGALYEKMYYDSKFKKWSKIYLILIILISLRYCSERVKPFSNKNRNPKWVKELKRMKLQYENDSKIVFFNFHKPIDAMFYTDICTYDFVPSQFQIDSLSRNGFTVLFNNPEKKYSLIKNVTFLEIN